MLTEVKKNKIIEALNKGLSRREIADKFDVSYNNVNYYFARLVKKPKSLTKRKAAGARIANAKKKSTTRTRTITAR